MEELTYNTFNEFITDALLTDGKLYQFWQKSTFIFRGESSLNYKLLPAILRENGYDKVWDMAEIEVNGMKSEFSLILGEIHVLSLFYKKCNNSNLKIPNISEFNKYTFSSLNYYQLMKETQWLPQELYELAGLAQHYGVPTRLIDWSQNLFTALYFASIGVLNNNFKEDDYLVIWALNTKSFQYSNKRLKIIKPPYYGNPNLAAQEGVFTFWEITKKAPIENATTIKQKEHNLKLVNAPYDNTPLDILLNEEFNNENGILFKIKIPNSEAKNIYKYLSRMRHDAAKLFPGYGGVKQSMVEDKYLFDFR